MEGQSNIWPHSVLLSGLSLGSICCRVFLNLSLIFLTVKRSFHHPSLVEILFFNSKEEDIRKLVGFYIFAFFFFSVSGTLCVTQGHG
jgi:hypothetical protein